MLTSAHSALLSAKQDFPMMQPSFIPLEEEQTYRPCQSSASQKMEWDSSLTLMVSTSHACLCPNSRPARPHTCSQATDYKGLYVFVTCTEGGNTCVASQVRHHIGHL
jgi:hypothetical protein